MKMHKMTVQIAAVLIEELFKNDGYVILQLESVAAYGVLISVLSVVIGTYYCMMPLDT